MNECPKCGRKNPSRGHIMGHVRRGELELRQVYSEALHKWIAAYVVPDNEGKG